MKRLIIEFENEIYWLYDDSEKNLLFYSDKIKELAGWLEQNIQDKKHYSLQA